MRNEGLCGRNHESPQLMRKSLDGSSEGWVSMKSSLVLLIVAIAVQASALSGQSASTAIPPVEIGLGVATTTPPAPALLDLWRRYLQSGPYDSHATTLWSAAEQRRWPSGFDLTVPWCYGSRDNYANSQAIVLDIAPATWGSTTSYAIRPLFLYRDSTMAKALPYVLCRVYAYGKEAAGFLQMPSINSLASGAAPATPPSLSSTLQRIASMRLGPDGPLDL
jgi:hypothetical protein